MQPTARPLRRRGHAALFTLAVCLPVGDAWAHGGQYSGPGDVVPPAPRGAGGRTPTGAGPTTGPRGGRPTVPGPAQPGSTGPIGPTGGAAGARPGAGPVTGRGIQLTDDLTRWEFWWEFNKAPYIRLREAIHTSGAITDSDVHYMGWGRRIARDSLGPTDSDIANTILPKLRDALEGTNQRDIVSSCLVALAKAGQRGNREIDLLALMRERLPRGDQEVRETAALAMGISQLPAAVDDLCELLQDSPAGRQLCDRGTVDDRTRSYAAYGLGLIAHAASDTAVKQRALDVLSHELHNEEIVSRDIKVALVNAIGILNPNVFDQAELAQACIQALEDYYVEELGQGEDLIQAHCPPAVAKLLGKQGPKTGWWPETQARWKERLLADLTGSKHRMNQISQSAALALGQLCSPVEDSSSADAPIAEALSQTFRGHRDQQTRYFALMAKGQMGGEVNRTDLMQVLARGKKALERPWAAMALGVLSFDELARAEATGRTPPSLETLGDALFENLRTVKNPASQGAFAVTLGLCRHKEAADTMRQMLCDNPHKEELAGYLCIGLALMGDHHSKDDIRRIVERSIRRPTLLSQAAIALGKLGDKGVADLLRGMLEPGDTNLAKMAAIASALGFIGDRRSIEPLVEMLFDENLTDLSRAFAAVALGGVADKEPLPWNSKIGVDMNYRAAVETLTNGVSGILDIL